MKICRHLLENCNFLSPNLLNRPRHSWIALYRYSSEGDRLLSVVAGSLPSAVILSASSRMRLCLKLSKCRRPPSPSSSLSENSSSHVIRLSLARTERKHKHWLQLKLWELITQLIFSNSLTSKILLNFQLNSYNQKALWNTYNDCYLINNFNFL